MSTSTWMIVGGLAVLVGAALFAGLLAGERARAAKAGDWIGFAGVLAFAAAALAGGWLQAGVLRDALLAVACVLIGTVLGLRSRRRGSRG